MPPSEKRYKLETVFYIIAKSVEILLSLISLAMLLRVVLQFFVDVEENRIYALCVYVSEPFILPFRVIMAKFNIGQNTPIDLPFFVAYISLSAISLFLPII